MKIVVCLLLCSSVLSKYSSHTHHSSRHSSRHHKQINPSTIPHVYKKEEAVEKASLYKSLMTKDKFEREFPA